MPVHTSPAAPGPSSAAPAPPLPTPPGRDGLAFDRTVPRQLVHRASVAEVFLTDGLPLGGDRFLVGAQWPRNHALYHPDHRGLCDFMLLAETVRQAGIYLSHQFYRVPLEHHFVFREFGVHLDDLAPLRTGAAPLNAVLEVTCVTRAGERDGERFPERFDAVVTVEGVPCARASIDVLVVDRRRYAVLRSRGRTPGTPPCAAPADEGPLLPSETVGLRRPENILLRSEPSFRPGTWTLRLDTAHAGYFEHGSDHVPGMVLMEAFRQAGHAATRSLGDAVLTSLTTLFTAFGEPDEQVVVTASASRTGSGLQLAAAQGQRALATATARYESRPA